MPRRHRVQKPDGCTANSFPVTGATGNIGSVLIERLRDRNATVTAAVTHPDKAATFESLGVRAVMIDFARPDSLIRAMDGVGCVFLLVPFGDSMTAWTASAVRAARTSGMKYWVRLSGFGANSDSKYSGSTGPYEGAHAE